MKRLSPRALPAARTKLAPALVVIGLAAAGAVSAAPPKPTAAQVKALAECVAVTDDAARLACYDKAARSLVEAEKTGDVVVVDQAQVKEVKRQSFGFNINLGPLFERSGDKAEQVNELTTAVASSFQDAEGKWVIHTAEGQVWRQIDTDPLYADPKKGDMVVIKRGSLGSYFLKVNNDRAMRAHRDE
jgi:hypothetical protein